MQEPTSDVQQVEAKPIVGGRPPGRNEPCPCGSELKYKHCHGSPEKRVIVQEATTAFANRLMSNLIHEERMRKGIEPYPWTCTACGKGCLKPVESITVPGTPVCPECSGVVEQTKVEENNGEDAEDRCG